MRIIIITALCIVAYTFVVAHTSSSDSLKARSKKRTYDMESPRNRTHKKKTQLEISNEYESSDYLIHLLAESNQLVFRGGNVSYMNLTTMPALAGHGISMAVTHLKPCGHILPHIHPRGNKGMYAIKGGPLAVGFIWENKAKYVYNILNEGDATFIPKGPIHFIQNLSCETTVNLNTYDYEDPGLLTLAPNLFRFQNPTLEAAFGQDGAGIESIRSKISTYALDRDPECMVRCGITD